VSARADGCDEARFGVVKVFRPAEGSLLVLEQTRERDKYRHDSRRRLARRSSATSAVVIVAVHRLRRGPVAATRGAAAQPRSVGHFSERRRLANGERASERRVGAELRLALRLRLGCEHQHRGVAQLARQARRVPHTLLTAVELRRRAGRRRRRAGLRCRSAACRRPTQDWTAGDAEPVAILIEAGGGTRAALNAVQHVIWRRAWRRRPDRAGDGARVRRSEVR